MFKVANTQALQKQVNNAEHNYVIQVNDHLNLDVFTNEGERIIDPNHESIQASGSGSEQGNEKTTIEYLVNTEGIVKFPMIGDFKIQGLTLRQAEEILQKEYAKYYQQPYVVLQYTNKRVVVLGSLGGQVIPLVNQNVKLVEVIAMARGIDNLGKAHNIRVLRGEQVFVADLSTVDGYLKNNMIIEPGDIVYVEPIRKPFVEGFRDYGPMLTILTSITTLLIVLTK